MGRKRKVTYELPPGRLWPNTPSGAALEIEVFGATGPYMTGKTLLGLSIAPGAYPEDHEFAGKERTLLLDFEKSAGTYAGTGCQRIDVPQEMLVRFKQHLYQPFDVFQWFLTMIDGLPVGRFDVIMADPVTDLDAGLVAFVKKYHERFGLTPTQIEKASGLLWGAVKDFWKQILLQLSTRCRCFYFTSHLRSVWEGNTPVRGKKEPKGKETLMELASLYLWLDRKADKEGNVPAVPSATVLKERLADTVMNEDGTLDIVQLLPPRLEEATVDVLRGYIANPPNYERLRLAERIVEETLSDDERLQIQADIATAQQATEETRLITISRQAELQELARQGSDKGPPPSDQTAKRQADKAALEQKAAKEEAEQKAVDKEMEEIAPEGEYKDTAGEKLAKSSPTADVSVVGITAEQTAEIKKLVAELRLSKEQMLKVFAHAKVGQLSELSHELATQLIAALTKKWVSAGN